MGYIGNTTIVGEKLLKGDIIAGYYGNTPLTGYGGNNITNNIVEQYIKAAKQLYATNIDYSQTVADSLLFAKTTTSVKYDTPATIPVYFPPLSADGKITITGGDITIEHDLSAGVNSYEIYNLIPGVQYSYTVQSGGSTVSSGTVAPEGDVRMMYIKGIHNVRDIGGWTTVDGTKRVKYGIMHRGTELKPPAGGHEYGNISAEGLDEFARWGIDSEIDLDQYDYEQATDPDVKLSRYYHYGTSTTGGITAYDKVFSSSSRKIALIQTLTQAINWVISGYNIYFHCQAGKDRTGSFSFYLLSLLGVGSISKEIDFELSCAANNNIYRTQMNYSNANTKINLKTGGSNYTTVSGDKLELSVNSTFTNIIHTVDLPAGATGEYFLPLNSLNDNTLTGYFPIYYRVINDGVIKTDSGSNVYINLTSGYKNFIWHFDNYNSFLRDGALNTVVTNRLLGVAQDLGLDGEGGFNQTLIDNFRAVALETI